MLNRIVAVVVLFLGLAFVGCRDAKPATQKLPYTTLLGVRSAAVISHFESTCPDHHIRWSDTHERIECLVRGLAQSPAYSLKFDGRGRIDEIAIEFHKTDRDILESFDRAIAPILPEDIREVLRRSITEPVENFEFSKPGGFVHIQVLTDPEGRHKTVYWRLIDMR